MTAFAVIPPEDLKQIIREVFREEMARTADPEWLPVQAYADRMGRSLSTVYRKIREGSLETRDICGQTQIKVA